MYQIIRGYKLDSHNLMCVPRDVIIVDYPNAKLLQNKDKQMSIHFHKEGAVFNYNAVVLKCLKKRGIEEKI